MSIARAIIETLDETSTLDDVTEVCDALNLYMDCKAEQQRAAAALAFIAVVAE